MGAVDRFFAAGAVLPTMPEVARRLIDSFEDEKIDLRQIVELAERDQSLASKILKQANSPRYGASGNVTNLLLARGAEREHGTCTGQGKDARA